MAETLIEQATCENCGVDVRENTLFCYNCGHRVAGEAEPETDAGPETAESPHITADSNGSLEEEMSPEARSALDDLAEKLKSDDTDNAERLALASAERKKARKRSRIKQETVWEPVEEGSYRLFVLITLLICVITAAIVFLMVYWK